MNKRKYNLITILGHTAGGKTSVAANTAFRLNGEVISADSRQVYRKMNIGTGKDYKDYLVEGKEIKYHLIDIHEPGYKYNVFEFQQDFIKVYQEIDKKGKVPILCGGSGLYIESVIKGYEMLEVPPDLVLRKELGEKSLEELTDILKKYKKLHNKTDIDTKKRAIRAIEIEIYQEKNKNIWQEFQKINPLVMGIMFDRDSRRRRIAERLETRLNAGMVKEVEELLNIGMKPDDLIYYGLEYKYITMFLTGVLSYNEMKERLNISIHQFAKRQMTWFRRMERQGIKIHWLDGDLSLDEKVAKIGKLFTS